MASPEPPDLDFGDFNDKQRLVLGVTITVLMLAIISFALRLYAKRITAANVWWDDYTIGVGLVFALIPCICNFVGLRYGLGRHASELPVEYAIVYSICLYVLLLAWIISVTIIKFGILLFYWRVFPGKSFRLSIYIVGTFIILCFISGFVGFVLQCLPVSSFWNHSIHATCLNENAFFDATATLAVVGDVVLLIQPIPVILRLKASRQTRMGLCVVFLTGGAVVVISAFRLASLNDIDPRDITWTNVGPGLWTTAEATIGVVSANLPFMRPLLGKAWSKAHNLRNSYKGAENNNMMTTEDRQALRNQGFTRMTDARTRDHLMGLTSTAQPGRRNSEELMEYEMGVPMHGITVKTEMEYRIEAAKREEMAKPPPVVMKKGSGGGGHSIPRQADGMGGSREE